MPILKLAVDWQSLYLIQLNLISTGSYLAQPIPNLCRQKQARTEYIGARTECNLNFQLTGTDHTESRVEWHRPTHFQLFSQLLAATWTFHIFVRDAASGVAS